MWYASNSAIYGGVRLRPTASVESRCSKEGIEVPIEEVIPIGIVKRMKEQREGLNSSARESKVSGADSENAKVAKLAKSPSQKEIPFYIHSSSSVSSVNGDKYGISLQSYDSASVISSNPRTDEIIKASRNYVSTLPNGSMVSVGSVNGAGKDKYGMASRSSASVSTIPSVRNWNKSKTSSQENIPMSRSYISNASKMTKESAESARDGPPPLIFGSSVIDHADESILETELCKKFIHAFELTLKNNPGILPGDPLVIDSLNSTLAKLMKDNDNRERQMKKQIDNVKAENEEMDNKLSDVRGSLTVKKIELTKELERAQQEKEQTEYELKKLTDANEAMKHDLKCRTDEATQEKDELTKHIAILTKSRDEIKSSLETEMKFVKKDREALRKVVDERISIQKRKAENKELESKIEIMTEAASKHKAALQAEAAEIKTFEEHLQHLKQTNDTIRKEVEDEKRELLEITLALQNKKQAVLESKAELEMGMQKEKEELENQVENSRMMHAKDMERLVKSKIVKYFKRGGSSEAEKDGTCDDGAVMDIESIIKSRLAVEVKQKEIEMKERELKRKEQMMEEKEIKERDIRKRELEEQRLKENDILEKIAQRMKMRERELEERIMRERKKNGLRLKQGRQERACDSELEEIDDDHGLVRLNNAGRQNGVVGNDDSRIDMNPVVKSHVVAQVRETEIELDARQRNVGASSNARSAETEDSLRWTTSSTSTQERCNKSFHVDRLFLKTHVSNDDETTLGDESSVALNALPKNNLTHIASEVRVGHHSEKRKQKSEFKTNGKDSRLTEMQEELQKLREEFGNIKSKKEKFEQMMNHKNEFNLQYMDEDSLKQNTHEESGSVGNNLKVKGFSIDFQNDERLSSMTGKVASYDKYDDKDPLSKTLPRSMSSSPLDFLSESRHPNNDDDANKVHTRAYRSCLLPRLTGLHQG
ncbi:hypothetical protein ACHAW6_013596 [Cyclotella cf. meneghiniana]